MLNPSSYAYKIEFVTSDDHPRRGVAFLISEDRRVTAKEAFDTLTTDAESFLRTRFDAWQGGQPNKHERYHGWDHSSFQAKYTDC